LPRATKRRNGTKRTRSNPAVTVSGSPTIGTQEKRRSHVPYLPNQPDARSIHAGEAGNQRRPVKCLSQRPSAQFRVAPAVLPTVAATKSVAASSGR
jgi:hypothetical protein